MHRIEIPDVNYDREIPSRYDELNKKQCLFFVRTMLLLREKKITVPQFKTELIREFCDIRNTARYASVSRKKNKSIGEKLWLDLINDNVLRLASLMDSFFELRTTAEGEQIVLSCESIKQLVPNFRSLTGPTSGCTNITLHEYKEARFRYIEYLKTQDENMLNELVAVLYRPRKPFLFIRRFGRKYNGDPRISITPDSNPYLFARRTRRVSQLPMEFRFYVFLFFQACDDYFSTGKPSIDGREIDLSILYQGSGKTDDIGLSGLIFSMAQEGVFGTAREVANTNWYDILARLYQAKRINDNIKAIMNKSK